MNYFFPRRAAVLVSLAAALALGRAALAAQGSGADARRFSLETSAWIVMNLLPDSGDFYQLTFGYRPDAKNAFFLNGITWKYRAPIAIPMTDPEFEDSSQDYPGYVRAFGLGLGYQRSIWKGLFVAAFATPFVQIFRSDEDDDLGTGFQLYLQAQAGYRFELFRGRFFVRPFLSCNWWPINTGFPSSFREKEERWPSYYLLEPHLNFGFRF
jgi:hypothetical protein